MFVTRGGGESGYFIPRALPWVITGVAVSILEYSQGISHRFQRNATSYAGSLWINLGSRESMASCIVLVSSLPSRYKNGSARKTIEK